MSLKFLAVGQSLAGIGREKSPYCLSKERQLPTFEATPRFKHAEKTMVQTDWLQARQSAPAAEISSQVHVQLPKADPAATPTKFQPKRRWLSFFGLKWFRTTNPKVDMVQAELTLEKVQPIRNDLADSDLRLVLKRKKKSGGASSSERRGVGWSELTAKLFKIGQQ